MDNTWSASEDHVALVDLSEQEAVEVQGPDAVVGLLDTDGELF